MQTALTRRDALTLGAFALAVPLAWKLGGAAVAAPAPGKFAVTFTPAQWKARLNPAAFNVLREQGTERPFTSPLNDEHRKGLFNCGGCALPVFDAATKFDSHTGWPSFFRALPKGIATTTDKSFMMDRTEVHCSRCGSHLGHVFDDGPPPTGLRYCMNGVALTFSPAKA